MNQHILLVDDEQPICEFVGAYLRKNGFDVTTANSGAEALKLMDDTQFCLMILDIALPEEDGLEILELVKASHPNLPVIMMTGMGFDEELLNEALSKKASGYLSKTLPPNQLLMEIRRTLKQNPGGSRAA